MKRKITLFLILMIANYLITPLFLDYSQGVDSDNVSNFLITSDEFGFYGCSLINDDLHFIYATNHRDDTNLIHFSVDNGKVIKKTIIEETSFSISKKTFLTTSSDQSFYFTYAISIKNETTQQYDHRYFCYYYNTSSNEEQKIFLADVTNYIYSGLAYTTPDLLGCNVLENNQAVFLLTSYNLNLNTTDVIAMKLEQNTKTVQTYVKPGKLEDVSSCYNSNNNSAYFLYFETGEDNFRLYEYNFTSNSLTNYSNCSFSHPDYSIRRGRLLFDQMTEKFYFICSIHSDTNFALFEYNTTTSTFNLTSITENAYATTNSGSGVLSYIDREHQYFDVYIDNSVLELIYRKSIAHSEIRQLALINYSLDNDEWDYFNLDLGNDLNAFHSRFIYDSTSRNYLDSYLIGYVYEDNSPYHSFGGISNLIASFGIYGSYANNINKPYSIRAIKSTYYWLIITSSIVIPLTLGGVGYYYIHRYKQKRTSREEN